MAAQWPFWPPEYLRKLSLWLLFVYSGRPIISKEISGNFRKLLKLKVGLLRPHIGGIEHFKHRGYNESKAHILV